MSNTIKEATKQFEQQTIDINPIPRELATTAMGIQNFDDIITNHYFYVDKTNFIKEWWGSGDAVTLITRPRRFGKTLTMSMIECFFSLNYREKGEKLFRNLNIWKEPYYQQLQGTYPVINLTFSSVKEVNFDEAKTKIYNILINLFNEHKYLLEGDFLSETERLLFTAVRPDMKEAVATDAIHQLSLFLYRYYGKKVIILLDEYDTPLQEAYIGGYWKEMVLFMRSLFGSTFKSNSYLERAIMTGVTRVSKESIFSDLNNLKVISTTSSDKYTTTFGFTEEEVFQALDEYHLSEEKEEVKLWYDGFIFGGHSNIYNPWSIINFLQTKEYISHWANTSSNMLVSNLVQKASEDIKISFEQLLKGETIEETIDEQIVFNQLDNDESAIWSLLLASGYLKAVCYRKKVRLTSKYTYTLAITNLETLCMFHDIVKAWFTPAGKSSSKFLKALLSNDVESMNYYMNEISLKTFSSFDTGKQSSKKEPERFYHGFVLGLVVELQDEYVITSNVESGGGRYDVMLKPLEKNRNAYVFEFKICTLKTDKTLEKTAQVALQQIREKQYTTILQAEGYTNIHTYGFAFRGKEVLIEKGE